MSENLLEAITEVRNEEVSQEDKESKLSFVAKVFGQLS